MGTDQSKLEPTRWLEESREGVLLCQALPLYIVVGYQGFQTGGCCGQSIGGWHFRARKSGYLPIGK